MTSAKLEQVAASIASSLKRLAPQKEEEPKQEPKEEEPRPVDELVAGIASIRSDLAAFGTGVGLVSGGLTTAAVLATLDTLFPIPASWQALLWLAVGLLLLAALGSALLTRRYFAARRRIVVETRALSPFLEHDIRNAGFRDWANLDRPGPERIFLTAPLDDYAHAELAPDIRTLELRIARLDRIAARFAAEKNEESAKIASRESARLSAGITLAVTGGAVSLIEYRSADVYKGWKTVALAMCVAVGVGGLFLLSDWSAGERDRVTQYLACAKDSKSVALCTQLDPRRLPEPSAIGYPKTPPPPLPSDSSGASSTPRADKVLTDLSSCASVLPEDPARVPSDLRKQALAACAGLPASDPAPSPTPTGSG